jgi:hypothetical protein
VVVVVVVVVAAAVVVVVVVVYFIIDSFHKLLDTPSYFKPTVIRLVCKFRV